MFTELKVTSRSRAAVLLVGIALIAAGCGDDDSTAQVAADTSAPSQTGSTAPVPADTTAPSPPATTEPPGSTAPTAPDTTTPPDNTAGTDSVTVDQAALQAILDEWRTEVNTFGATLSIRLPGHDDIVIASGVDDRSITSTGPDGSPIEHTEAPMPTDGTYPMGYVTRTFVAAAALQLVDEGRLSLDEPVQPWLPELPNADQITLRMLLGYTSGLGQWDDADHSATLLADLSRSYTPEEVLARHLERPPVAPPGGDPSFGRVGYIAVGLLIERILDQDLATVIRERFIEPLSLDDTVFSDGSRPTRHGWLSIPPGVGADRPVDYLDLPQQAAMTTLWASEAMISTSTDVLDWGEALLSGDVLGPETTATMLDMNPVSPPPVPNRYFALGATGYCLEAGCNPDEAELVGAPGGGFCCWQTQLVYHRESGTTIFVHVNTNDPAPAALIQLPIKIVQALGLT